MEVQHPLLEGNVVRPVSFGASFPNFPRCISVRISFSLITPVPLSVILPL